MSDVSAAGHPSRKKRPLPSALYAVPGQPSPHCGLSNEKLAVPAAWLSTTAAIVFQCPLLITAAQPANERPVPASVSVWSPSLAESKMLPNLAASLDSATADHVYAWLTSRLDLDAPQARKFFLTSPTLLRMPVAKLDDRIQFLTARLDLSDAQLRKLVSKLPASLGMLPASMEHKLTYLERRLGLSPPQLRKLVCTAPGALSRSVEGTLMPKLDAVQARLGLSDAELGAIVVRYPTVLGYSYEAKVAPSLDKLQAPCMRSCTRACALQHAHAACNMRHAAALACLHTSRVRAHAHAGALTLTLTRRGCSWTRPS